ncbi:MFS transporter [Rhodococcus sp. IEGM 1318]|nr:MFS transporter [Rhodococcus sp. IEGM 1318]MDV8005780.1 MFS transporter [Rhodococcus sp. IEGM 1318]
MATGVQFALARLETQSHLILSSAAAVASTTTLALALTALPVPELFVCAALFAGAAQGLGQLAGLTLIATHVPGTRRAEANAALNIAGYIPAAMLPVATGYLIDATGLTPGVLAFAGVLGAAAMIALMIVGFDTTREVRIQARIRSSASPQYFTE